MSHLCITHPCRHRECTSFVMPHLPIEEKEIMSNNEIVLDRSKLTAFLGILCSEYLVPAELYHIMTDVNELSVPGSNPQVLPIPVRTLVDEMTAVLTPNN